MGNSNMMLMFSHSVLWKHYHDQTTVIHIINVVHAKGTFDDVACKHLRLLTSAAK